ncbi:hypothetical protein SISSUDRAFT_1050153, partial [Sistotremastrum suecicum HHB10207 ss-3]
MASSVFTRRSRDSSTGCRSHLEGRQPYTATFPEGLTELNLGRDIQLLSPAIYGVLPTRIPRPPLYYGCVAVL